MSTVVIDPTGAPVPLFLRSGIAVVDVAAAHDVADGNYPTGTSIPLPTDHVIARVTTTPGEDNAVELPSAADVGVLVELYDIDMSGFQVQAPSGDNIDGASFFTNSVGNRVFRKISAVRWGRIG
jgi:hypothetical protein